MKDRSHRSPKLPNLKHENFTAAHARSARLSPKLKLKKQEPQPPKKPDLNFPKDRYRVYAKVPKQPAPALSQFLDTLEKDDLVTLQQ